MRSSSPCSPRRTRGCPPRRLYRPTVVHELDRGLVVEQRGRQRPTPRSGRPRPRRRKFVAAALAAGRRGSRGRRRHPPSTVVPSLRVTRPEDPGRWLQVAVEVVDRDQPHVDGLRRRWVRGRGRGRGAGRRRGRGQRGDGRQDRGEEQQGTGEPGATRTWGLPRGERRLPTLCSRTGLRRHPLTTETREKTVSRHRRHQRGVGRCSTSPVDVASRAVSGSCPPAPRSRTAYFSTLVGLRVRDEPVHRFQVRLVDRSGCEASTDVVGLDQHFDPGLRLQLRAPHIGILSSSAGSASRLEDDVSAPLDAHAVRRIWPAQPVGRARRWLRSPSRQPDTHVRSMSTSSSKVPGWPAADRRASVDLPTLGALVEVEHQGSRGGCLRACRAVRLSVRSGTCSYRGVRATRRLRELALRLSLESKAAKAACSTGHRWSSRSDRRSLGAGAWAGSATR